MSKKDTTNNIFYITTAIDYVNNLPHIGTAYEKIAADAVARAHRILGYDVLFSMGTDEHSINVKKKAREAGLSPTEYCDGMAPKFEAIWKKLSISYDKFIRTTDSHHKTAVSELFNRINEAGDIYTDDYKGWYCEGCEAFIQEKELVDGKCPNHNRKPSWIEETNYFFKLSKFEKPLLDRINSDPDFIRPASRRNEIVRLLEGGLEDISVSRSGFDWGIPLPIDESHVVYVWFDALINYISVLGFGSDDNELFEKYWPADVHVIGKDITRFHCVIWPAMLMSAGVELPKSIFGHGFIYHRGEKMSKSLGNVVAPLDVVDRYGAGPLRYFLLREVTFGQDGDFTWERFIERYNSDLANDLGNLVSRTVSMIGKYIDGVIPDDASLPDDSVTSLFADVAERWGEAMHSLELSKAADILWELIRAANKRVEDAAPWKLAKDPEKRDELIGVLYDLASAITGAAVLLSPFMPETAQKVWEAVGNDGDVTEITAKAPFEPPYAPKNRQLEKKPKALFPRIEEKKVMTEEQKEAPKDAAKETYITIDDFAKLDIRIGTITSAQRVEKSDKLIRLKIDDGTETGRTILAGIAEHYEPEELEGRQVPFIANLKPRKMMGEFSEGMVLAAVDGDTLSAMSPLKKVSPGTKVS